MLEDEGRLRRALRDPDVNRWHANLAERSELTADIYARRLDRFCEEFKTTPSALWKLDSKAAYNSLIDAVRHYRNKKLTGSTIKGYLKPVISWFRENDIILTKSINISGADKTPTLDDEKSPEPYELHSIWRFCNPREAALVALEAFTGCRPQVFGNYKGTDGLRISDLPEMEVGNETKRVNFKVVPTRVVVRREVSKEGNQYETFLAEEGAGKVAAYLERRMRLGEFLTPISAVIADDDGKGRTLTTKSMYQIVKKPFKRAGLTWRPYILRRYTDVRLGQAAAKPEMGLPESWVTFWMGHHGDIESIYRHKRTLSDSQLEQMREAYARGSEMLQTIKLHKENGAQIRREIRTTALLAVGCSDDEIRQLDLEKLTTDEFSEALRQRLEPRKPSVLRALGFVFEVCATSDRETPSPNYLLTSINDAEKRKTAFCLAYNWGRNLDGKDEMRDTTTPEENPSYLVVSLLGREVAPYAIVTNGKQWRLYAAQAPSRATSYYEIDLEETLASDDPNHAFRYLYLLFRSEAFVPRKLAIEGQVRLLSFLDLLLLESEAYASGVGERLKEKVFERIFPYFAEGFVEHMDGGSAELLRIGESERQIILDRVFQGTLTFLYRLLFLFYAESRDLLPIRELRGYWKKSLTGLKDDVSRAAGPILEETSLGIDKRYSRSSTTLYDGKSQVTVEYQNGQPKRVSAVVIAAQHDEHVHMKKLRRDITEAVVRRVIPKRLLDARTKIIINGTGRFIVGGTLADSGVVGRKIVVDSYGGAGSTGGDCYSGKDATKVDRSGGYMARYIAKNIVAADLADRCGVQIAYAIGLTKPVSFTVDTYGTGRVPDEKIAVAARRVFDMTPRGMIEHLKLRCPIYRKTATYGHFGRNDPHFAWEKTDKVAELKRAVKL
jgi:hypothetical protein